jgi:hypothetical protein
MTKGRPEGTYTPVGNLMVNLDKYYRSLGNTDANGCVLWTGPWHRQGYGMIGAKRIGDNRRIMTVAHRITAMLSLNRALTRDEFVIHTCSNVRCQEPTHLIIGDYSTKAEIMTANGRSNYCGNRSNHPNTPPRKQANRQYRYSDEEILWVRSASTQDIAARYGITRSRAAHMRFEMRIHYKWLKGPDQ